MHWRCAECGRAEDARQCVAVDAACHHCGKVLCSTHQVVVAADSAFAPSGAASRAVHCRDCRRRHHRIVGSGRS
jgi:hypothetical protein